MPVMDSDEEEELAALLEEEAAADVQEEEHLMVLAALAQLLASNEKPRRGGSAPGRVKAKNRHRLEGYCMLYSDYQHRLFLQVLSGSGGSVWTAILENTQCGRHCLDPSTECSKRISWDAWKHRLHALEMEELPICLAGDVQRLQRRLQCGT